MHVAKVQIEGITPYSQSRFTLNEFEKREKESHEDYDERVWREKAHYNKDGNVVIPQMAFKTSLQSAAQYLGIQIAGKGKATYTKHFVSGVLVMNPPVIIPHYTRETVEMEMVHCASNGMKGAAAKGKVWRRFPVMPEWSCEVVFDVLDDIITEEVFITHLRQAGQFRGIGRFRPESGGYYGRFSVKNYEWSEQKF